MSRPHLHFSEFTEQLQPGQIALGLFEALPDVMFWLKDVNGYIIFANRAYAQLLQRTPDDLVGETDESLFPQTMAAFFKADDQKVLKSAKPLHNKLEIITRPAGGIEWRMTSKIPLFGKDQNVVGTAGVSRRLEHGEGPPLPTPHRAISELIDQIHANLGDDINIPMLAQQAGMSVSSLERRFRKFLGTTPHQYLVRARIASACDKLLNTTLSIGQIAASLAYQEHASFTRAFISVMHMSPKDYRAFDSLAKVPRIVLITKSLLSTAASVAMDVTSNSLGHTTRWQKVKTTLSTSRKLTNGSALAQSPAAPSTASSRKSARLPKLSFPNFFQNPAVFGLRDFSF